MARPRSTGYAGQLEQILAAAARHFATRGYTATTMNDVAAACGVSKATLYHYVRDKQDLLAHITAGHVARACGPPPMPRLRRMQNCVPSCWERRHEPLDASVLHRTDGGHCAGSGGQARSRI